MFNKMPFILLLIIAVIFLVGPYISTPVLQFFYSISLSLKSMVVMVLPLVIFLLLFKTFVLFGNKATTILLAILLLVCASNFFAALVSQTIGHWVYQFDFSILSPQNGRVLEPLWSLQLPTLIANDRAMLIGILCGFLAAKLFHQRANRWALNLEIGIRYLFQKFIYVIPFFVAGFIIKLQYEGLMGLIIKDYLMVFATVATAQFVYLILAYFALSGFKTKVFLMNIRNMLPAAISGFSTMSSAATMPLTIIGAEKNCTNKDVVRSVIPAVTNVHLIGDCFVIPILIYATMKSFGLDAPSLATYLPFAFYFMLAKFSVAAIPGGGIIVVLPLLQEHFGFIPDMMLLATALYILFDPFGTTGNVLGNGAFAKMIDRFFGKRLQHRQHENLDQP